ncbi:sodium-independent sulfate anion transporter-like [Cimex lectularius]|uniref:STAS domain-containing protein n=1 Tax=Cimex lectularius TaxID=79782 RepID=A0A8I6TD22_CIMLE|nr:sodium-independent sulfate anion transporter-like [Cimex lectularius]XP_014240673.1 sodium-independent sulfate anion transporter-like [Cimex lectularius]XP_014240674.1 sodium-independent sulfate anion transporter-like [Cimex lectularius]
MTVDKAKLKVFLRKRIPIISWLPKYNSETAIADLIAGVTVGLTVMPQALAYAALAGLQPQYGLYSSFIGCFVYTVFGSCKDITIGPTALMSLMTYQQVHNRNPDYAVLLCFLTGCVMLVMTFLRLGVLVEFISQPVTVGFTTATSVIIVVSQVKGLLGLSYDSGDFISTVQKAVMNIHNTRIWDATMGFVCIAILLFLRKIKDFVVVDNLKSTKRQRIIAKSFWLLSTSRNALIVIVCSLLSYFLKNEYGETPFKLTGNVRSGIPPIQFPPFSTTLGNQTVGFTEMVSQLGSSVILVPVIAVLGNVAIAKAFAGGEPVDATQELFTLAGCNLLGSFVSSMPITGSFSRSAVNHASGVRTTMGGVYTGVLLLLALGALTPYFYYIPKASLAAVIICAVIFMIEYEVIKPMWKASRRDIIPMFATFITCLLIGVELGILIGVGINIALLLFYSAKPNIKTEKSQSENGIEYMCVKPNSSIYFPGVEHFRYTVLKAGAAKLPVVIDCSLVESTDFTTAKGISSLLKDFKSRSQALIFVNVHPSLLAVLKPICTQYFVYMSSSHELGSALAELRKYGNPEELTHISTELKELPRRDPDDNKDCEEPLLVTSKPLNIVPHNPEV